MLNICKNIIIFFIIITLFSCRVTRILKPEEDLLSKVKIKIDNKNINKDKLYSFLKQKPNKKLLNTIPFYLWMYKVGASGKENKFNNWLKNTVGEKPVIFDSLLMIKSAEQMHLYLNSKGYYNNNVIFSVKHKNKKVLVEYIAKTGKAYIINNIDYDLHSSIKSFILNDTVNSYIKKYKIFDIEVLQNERDRVTKMMKNNGFFYFSKSNINFLVDTALRENYVNIRYQVKDNKQSVFKRFKINKIIVYANYNNLNNKLIDSVFSNDKKIKILYPVSEKLLVKPKIISHSIFIEPGKYYNITDLEKTYNHLYSLGIFKFINIQFKETNEKSNNLNCIIQLSYLKSKSFSLEMEGTNRGGFLGVGGNLTYLNKNLTKAADKLKIMLRAGMEVQRLLISGENQNQVINKSLPFNTIEFGPELKYEIPRFLIPVKLEKFSKNANPFTSFNTFYSFQKRPDYARISSNFSFNYSWNESAEKKHIITPAEISIVKIFPEEGFSNLLQNINNPFLLNSYQDHLISASKYTFIYNNRQKKNLNTYTFFQSNAEFAGNFLSLISKKTGLKKDEQGSFEIFKIPFAQYIRTDIDYRIYKYYNKHNSIALRYYSGIGVAYGNLNVLPFEKSFYAGGANGMRAWLTWGLGPGSFYSDNDNQIFKTGDIQLESNIEYRFDIFRVFEGAIFTDAGNIWILRKDLSRPNAEFNFNRFYKEIALDLGIGLRLDFSFFIIRIDLATPIHNPAKPLNSRWKFDLKKTNLNLGIGYPF